MSFMNYLKYNPDFLNNYLLYKAYIEMLSINTVNEMYFDIRTFFRFLKIYDTNLEISKEDFKKLSIIDISIDDLKKVDQQTISSFIYFACYTLENQPKTRNRKLSSVKKLFQYLDLNNHIAYNPSNHSKVAKNGKRVPKYLNIKQSKQLLSNIINSDDRNKIRNYAITCLFLNCGLRLSELVELNISDIKLDEGTIKVTGKGDKERLLYLDSAAKEAIKKYKRVRPKIKRGDLNYNAFFISEKNKRISRRMVQEIITKELNNLFEENKAGFHTHSLRHTNATLMYQINKTKITTLKRMLGHSDLRATEVYVQTGSEQLKYIMENCTISNFIERMGKNEK